MLINHNLANIEINYFDLFRILMNYDIMQDSCDEKQEYLLKVLIVGEAATGKTSFIKRYVHQFFSRAYKATIGVDFALKTIQYDENTVVRLQLWDIAGHERFGSMTRVYYKDAVGAFIVYDVNRPKTFDSVIRWKNDIDSKVSLSDGSNIPCLLLANKCDLVDIAQQDHSMLKEFVEQNEFIEYIHTSPKDDVNIDEAAMILIQEILKRKENLNLDSMSRQHDASIISVSEDRKPKTDSNLANNNKSSCC